MPEEINRVVTDHLSTILFCSSENGVAQLAKEGISKNVFNVGDVMYDAVKMFRKKSTEIININHILPFSIQKFCLLTLHRPSNTDDTSNLTSILQAIEQIKIPVLWPLHPRLKDKMLEISVPSNIFIVNPLSYFEMLCLLENCYKVFTDSGGLQKEAYWLKKPCITIRNETEWVETLHDNWNILAGPQKNRIENAFFESVTTDKWYPIYGDGAASLKIAQSIKNLIYP